MDSFKIYSSPNDPLRKETLYKMSKFEKLVNAADRGPFIRIVNNVDNQGIQPYFTYINECFFGPGVPCPDPSFLTGCDCVNGCHNNPDCLCLHLNNHSFPYDENGILNPNHGGIYECNLFCKCGSDCLNRVVQNGRKVSLDIVRFSDGRGWGVVSAQDIKKGTYISTYTGEIITNEEAEQRAKIYDANDRAYLFDLDFFLCQGAESEYTIDARQYGNISHFFNHSCDPNIRVYACLINHHDERLHHNTFFACKDIKRGQELCFDYTGLSRDASSNVVIKRPKEFSLPCLCGSSQCRKFVYR